MDVPLQLQKYPLFFIRRIARETTERKEKELFTKKKIDLVICLVPR